MLRGGRQAADEGIQIGAGSYPGLMNTASSASGLLTEFDRPHDIAGRAERALLALPAGDDVIVEVAPQPTENARGINRRVLGLTSIDLIAALIASVVAYVIDSDAPPWGMISSEPSVLMLPVAWLVLIAVSGGFDERDTATRNDEIARVFRAFLYFAVVVAIASYATHDYFARGFLLIALPLALTFSIGGRFAARAWLHRRRARALKVRSVLVVGDVTAVSAFAEAVQHDRSADIVVSGACLIDGDDPRAMAALDVPTVGDIDSVVESARAIGAATIAVVSAGRLGSDRLRWIAWRLEGTGIDLLVAPGLVEVARRRVRIRSIAWMPLLHVEQPQFRGVRRVLKEIMDRLIALLAAVMLAPVFAVILAAVRLSTPGPAIFRQTRVGRDGKTFQMLKFRSMFVDAEARLAELKSENVHQAGPLFKLHSDPRVTRIGHILRRYSLDELPQLMNVLLGHMSLVGPRPPLPSEVSEYETDARRRLLVKPGMTGLWQVSGRSDLSWTESVRLDLRYVENWSPALDLMILWKTASAVFRGSGAY